MSEQDRIAFEKWVSTYPNIKCPKDFPYKEQWHLPFLAWQAATAESAERIAVLDGEVAESDFVIDKFSKMLAKICLTLKGEPPYCTRFSYHDLPKIVKELQANNHDLREALKIAYKWMPASIHIQGFENDMQIVLKALSTTTAESLAKHDNDVLERAAKVAMDMPSKADEIHEYRASDDCKAIAWDISHAIRALKEVK